MARNLEVTMSHGQSRANAYAMLLLILALGMAGCPGNDLQFNAVPMP